MTLSQQINSQLDRIAATGTSGDLPAELIVPADPHCLKGLMREVDRLGCSFERLSLETGVLAGASIERLKEISRRLTEKITYLLESISPIEIDHDQCVVQMRSNPPQQDDDGASYYELLVGRTGLTLVRYSRPPGCPRQPISAHVTREVFSRLAGDFVAVLA